MKSAKTKSGNNKINPVPWIIVIGIIVLIVGGCLLWVYVFRDMIANSKQQVFVYNRTDGSYSDEKSGICYLPAPAYYQASAVISDPAYARSDKNKLFRVGTRVTDKDGNSRMILCSAGEWLSTDKDHGMRLYYNKEKVTLPTVEEFKPELVYFCTTSGVTIGQSSMEAKLFFPDGFLDNSAENLFGTSAHTGADLLREIRVTSSEYTWMQLVLYLYRNEELGEYYIYMPQREQFVKADSQMLDVFFGSSEKDGSE